MKIQGATSGRRFKEQLQEEDSRNNFRTKIQGTTSGRRIFAPRMCNIKEQRKGTDTRSVACLGRVGLNGKGRKGFNRDDNLAMER